MERADTVAEVRVYGYDLSYAHGTYVMSKGREITVLRSVVVALTARSGATGYGEVCPLGSTYLPGFAGGIFAALAELGPALIGQDPGRPGAVGATMDECLAGHAYAKSAIDIAALDLFGRQSGLSCSALLGGKRLEDFLLYVAVPLNTPAAMADFVGEARAEGIHRFQLKIGGTPEQDAARAAAVVAATGPEDVIVADANGGWRLQDATVAVRLLDGLERLRLEQPCPTIEECLILRQRTSLPFVLDEVITDVAALIRCYEAGAMDAINVKISRLGGLTRARQLRDLAQELGLRLTIEDTWGGDLTTAAVSHLAATTAPEALYAASFMNDWTLEHIAGYRPRSVAGTGRAPVEAGLGVAVDEALLGEPVARYR